MKPFFLQKYLDKFKMNYTDFFSFWGWLCKKPHYGPIMISPLKDVLGVKERKCGKWKDQSLSKWVGDLFNLADF